MESNIPINPRLLPVVISRPKLLCADFDGDSPSGLKLRSPYRPLKEMFWSIFVSATRAAILVLRIKRKIKHKKNQLRRRKRKALRRKARG